MKFEMYIQICFSIALCKKKEKIDLRKRYYETLRPIASYIKYRINLNGYKKISDETRVDLL